MPAKPYCRTCDINHERPVGRNCARRAQVGEVAATAGSISGPSLSVSNANPPDLTASNLILNKLTSIQGQLTSMDERVRKNEAALAGRTTDRAASASESLTPNPASSVAQNFDLSTTENVVPNTDFLQNSDVIQKHVDARLLECSSMASKISKGVKMCPSNILWDGQNIMSWWDLIMRGPSMTHLNQLNE